jgi:2-polyprenyl-3-methyl-5-hydroxy-6-metoxy-1,4-benzoquinol methylase
MGESQRMTGVACILCGSDSTEPYWHDQKRAYLHCRVCELVFVPPQFWLSSDEERCEYDKHDNNPDDAGYRVFLGRAIEPVNRLVMSEARGLDFGCGPGPVLSMMLAEQGYCMSTYDKFYAPDTCVLEQSYDFITMTEVIEHIHNPFELLPKVWNLIHPNGLLVVMTKRVISLERFKCWHYKNDPTHIAFYSEQTFEWIANLWGADLQIYSKDVVTFQKS